MEPFGRCKIDEKSYVPKYFQLKEILRRHIDGMQPDEMLPSEHRLAERFKLHRLTARQAITELVKEGRLYRLHGRGTFVSKHEKKNAAGTVACLFRGIRPRTRLDNFFLEIFEAFETELSAHKKFMLYKCLDNLHSETEICHAADEIAGIKALGLVLDERVPDGVLEHLDYPDFPVFLLHRRSPVKNVRAIVFDARMTAELQVDYLLRLGHRQMLFIHETAVASQWELRTELQKLAEERRHEFELNVIAATEDDMSGRVYREAVAEGLANHRFTALIGGSDWIGGNAYRTLNEHGLRVPEDISVIGTLGLPVGETYSPPLTSVKFDAAAMGTAAARAALFPRQTQGDVAIPVSLLERHSCAPVKKILKTINRNKKCRCF